MFYVHAYALKPQVAIFNFLFYMYSLDAFAIPFAVSFEIHASNFQTQYDIDVYFTGRSRDLNLSSRLPLRLGEGDQEKLIPPGGNVKRSKLISNFLLINDQERGSSAPE